MAFPNFRKGHNLSVRTQVNVLIMSEGLLIKSKDHGVKNWVFILLAFIYRAKQYRYAETNFLVRPFMTFKVVL